ncbi:hypothetical protein OPV22_003145 [Ensete ventricosum]|uniref:Major facilitator superfamily (MFS) profile domain-containing protein n=1 Tax=Ensete ventricosum TaxID=4639 RepID=A0AAV8S013_ENSVE|nr:hypothetical protein OPV22_003145 [Ensete ventricosum]
MRHEHENSDDEQLVLAHPIDYDHGHDDRSHVDDPSDAGGGVTSMDPFLEKFFPDVYADMKDSRTSNYYMFDSQLLIAFTSALYIAGLFASFCASKVMQAFNHRASMLLGGAVFLVGDVLGGLAIIVFVLILGRILPPRRRRRFHQTGILYWLRSSLLYLFFFVQSAPLYLSEMAPPEYRGAINNGFDFFIGFGTLSANMINLLAEQLFSSN